MAAAVIANLVFKRVPKIFGDVNDVLESGDVVQIYIISINNTFSLKRELRIFPNKREVRSECIYLCGNY